MVAISEPRLGYAGLIGKRLDLGLIMRLAKRRPGWSFVFVGKADRRDCETEMSALEALDNVFFLGEKNQSRVANYVAAMNIGLLPYQRNVETEHISPLKMYEYLAVGLPVVSTAIPAALRHSEIVEVADNENAFERACEDALMNDSSRQEERRLNFAASNTWDQRIVEITDIIASALKKNG
jgi:glycosyltransferase involved in cell wall biosynthesis